jgi:drug/metabolite transporter (DMT)-like permease
MTNLPGAQALQRNSAVLLLILIVLVWGVNWPLSKMILTYVSPLWFVSYRMALGTATMFAIQALQPEGIKLPHAGDLPIVATVGIAQMAGMLSLMNLGLHYVPAGRSSIVCYTTPLWVVPGAILILGERLTISKFLALLVGLAGIAFLFNPAGFDWSDRRAIIGNGYLLGAAAVWAVAIIHVRAHRWHGTPLALTPWQLLLGFIPVTALAWAVEGPPPPLRYSFEALLVAIYAGPLITAFPFWAVVTVTRRLPAVTTSLTLLATPVVGLLSSVALLGERLDATTVTGLVLIVGAVGAVTLIDAKRPQPRVAAS